MSNAEPSNALALTPWGTSTLDALQGAAEKDRVEIARRACEDAISDARTLTSLQGSLFEKLLVIERFGLYRSQLVKDGESVRGCESIQEFIERAVAPVVQLHRATLFKLREAVGEAGRLLGCYGTLKADWTNLYLLAAETRRQIKGGAVLAADDYERVSQKVAEGRLSQRELSATLQRRPPVARPERVQEQARCLEATPRAPRRVSPFEELAKIAADVRGSSDRPSVDFGRTLWLTEELLGNLQRLSLSPVGAWSARPEELSRFLRLMANLRDMAATAAEVARLAEAA